MKVLIDHQIFSYQKFGGISRYFYELIHQFETLEEIDYELASAYTKNYYLCASDPSKYYRLPVNIPEQARLFLEYQINAMKSKSSLKRGNYSLFHPTFYDPYFLKYIGKKPFTVTYYDMTPELFPDCFVNKTLYYHLITSRWIAAKREIARRLKRSIAISENTKEDMVRLYGISPEKIEVVHLGLTLDPIRISPEPQADLVDKKYLLFVGGRSGYKNFQIFTQAVRPILKSREDLYVVCAGGGAFSEIESTWIAEAGLEKRWIRKDMNDAGLAWLYQNAEAFIFPSTYEGFGLPILEAFAWKCPLALSNASCFPEIAGDAGEYFDPFSESDMNKAICRLLDNTTRRDELVEKGLSRLKLFSWERAALETLRVYQSLI